MLLTIYSKGKYEIQIDKSTKVNDLTDQELGGSRIVTFRSRSKSQHADLNYSYYVQSSYQARTQGGCPGCPANHLFVLKYLIQIKLTLFDISFKTVL